MDGRNDSNTGIDDNLAVSQPSEARLDPTYGDKAPGSTNEKGMESKEATRVTINDDAEKPDLKPMNENGKPVEDEEVQSEDPRKPKLKLGPLYLFKIIGREWIPIPIAAVCAGVTGVAPLLFFEVLGGLFGSLGGGSDIQAQTSQAALYIFIIALVAMVLQFFSHGLFNLASQRMGNRVKMAYFNSVTMQEIGFFDIKKAGSIANSLGDDVSRVTDALSTNFQDLCQYTVQFVVAVILAIIANYAMALFDLICVPIILVILGIAGRLLEMFGRRQGRLLGDSISTANEVIGSMRTVRSMAGEKREINRYKANLAKTRWLYIATAFTKGFAFSAMVFTIWGCIALAFWFGGLMIGWGRLDVGGFIKVYGLVLLAVTGLTQIFAVLPEVIKALASVNILLEVIKREPAIRFKGGKRPEEIHGNIEFTDVTFRYPARPKQAVLKNFSLKIDKGTSVALVGQSGSGKSTIVGLIEKWYEPESGKVTLDGEDITEIDPQWLHRYVGIVQQEPTLFATTIKRNITYAVDTINMLIKKEAKKENKKITDDQLKDKLIEVNDETIEKAAKMANCHEFIMTLPDKYDTVIGERGVSMSGGQKQRVAIARAVLQDPKILLLDEATSALDTKSESLVQDALNKLMVGRTSIVIAHRLTTVQDCDNIVVMREGKVVEMGKHDDLLDKKGAYFSLAKKQMKLGGNDTSTSDLSNSDGESDLSSRVTTGSTDEHDHDHTDDDINLSHTPTTHEYKPLFATTKPIKDDSNNFYGDSQPFTIEPSSSPKKQNSTPTTPIEEESEMDANKQVEPNGVAAAPADEQVQPNKSRRHRRHRHEGKLRRRHRERKNKRKQMEEFTNEEDVVDQNAPKVYTGLQIIPYLGPEWFLILLGAIGSAVNGAAPIAFYIVFGRVVNALIPPANLDGTAGTYPPGYDIAGIIARHASYLAIVAAGACVGQFFNMTCFSLANDRVGIRLRNIYFKSVVHQELGFFDIKKAGKLINVMSEDMEAIQTAFTSRVSIFVQYASQFTLGVIFALITDIITALLALAAVLFLFFFVIFMSTLLSFINKKIGHLSASSMATASEVIGSMRTVRSMGGEEREQGRLNNDLKLIAHYAIFKGLVRGVTQMVIQFIILGDAAFVFWYGGRKLSNGQITPGALIQVFGFILLGVLGLSLGLTEVPNIVKGINAAKEALVGIKRKPLIPMEGGETLEKVEGNIEFTNITFSYPSRPNIEVLKNFSLSIKKGQHVALVGESGCGKSTITGLLERFYDPKEGKVELDGLDLSTADATWLHKNVAIVTQEPILFATNIKKNIEYSVGGEEQTMEKIIECCKAANCHDFISKLPNGYETEIGERGVSMSGGQKQRIAIARAMLQNANVLILDEATSALDTEAEALVQDALNKLMKGKTSVVIAHRLSTVQDCDMIVAMKAGKVVEKGTHQELIEKKGMYYKLAKKQMEFGNIQHGDAVDGKDKKQEEEIQMAEND
ncbi:ATP-binding cassette, subfamily B protein [Acrasis kona]|uniref:ATP-binding cassette, subfamily B protein n=1 Tax=Acrasis kona TaxID=1008807 RepID=A0AAW2YHP3_9EUKA